MAFPGRELNHEFRALCIMTSTGLRHATALFSPRLRAQYRRWFLRVRKTA